MKPVLSVLLVLAVGSVLLGGSCRVRTSPSEPSAEPAGPGKEGPVEEVEKPLDIGDAEAALSLELTMPGQPLPPNIKVDELRNMRGDLDLVTVTVKPPHPQELPLELTMKSKQAFPVRPLLVRLTIVRDKKPIDSQAVTVAGDAIKRPFAYTFDALKGVEQAPGSMLLHAEAEIIMLPAGADVEAIDPATVKADPEWTGAKVSNPVRVNFAGEDGSQ